MSMLMLRQLVTKKVMKISSGMTRMRSTPLSRKRSSMDLLKLSKKQTKKQKSTETVRIKTTTRKKKASKSLSSELPCM